MCVTAHPDDETGSFGGALMQAHARGIETSVVCLTQGSAGSHRGEGVSDHDLGAQRSREFADALNVLQVDHGEILEYPDGKLARQNFLEITEKLVERIRRFRPQVILTYGGDGNVNLHPDHTMVSLFTTAAFHWAGRSIPLLSDLPVVPAPYRPQKLYYAATVFLPHESPEEMHRIPLIPTSLVIQLGDLTSRKVEAFRRHRTQSAILERLGPVFEEHAAEEHYLLAAVAGMRTLSPETDMFEGVSD
jgi:LmbE family N-acetylglucosaminyl deacetylase